MSNQTIHIVGGGSGVGEECASHIAHTWGYEVFTPKIEELDVTKPYTIRDYLEFNGPIENLIYTAGVNQLCWIKDMRMSDLIHHYSVNTFGLPMIAAEHLRMFPNAAVNVVAIVSDSYRTPMRSSLAYGSSKAALVAVIRTMARELADTGWRVNGVSPGIIDDTPMTDYIDDIVPKQRGWTPEEARAYENTMVPIKRRVTKAEVAETVSSVLFGAEAMTGSIVEITGGK